MRHYTFQSYAYDLGIFMQHLWMTIHGHGLLYSSVSESTGLAWHFQPILFLLMPLYAVFPRAETLLVLQTVVLAAGAVPVYFLASSRMDARMGVAFSLAYLLFPALHGVNTFDFHPGALAIPSLLLTILFFERGQLRAGVALAILSMMCEENVALTVAAIGLYYFVRAAGAFTPVSRLRTSLRERAVSVPLGLALFASLWLVCALFIVISHFSLTGSYPYFARYTLGATFSLADNLVVHATEKVRYVLDMFGPLLFLPGLAPGALLLALPGLAQNLLAVNVNQVAISCQYSNVVIPGLYASAVFGASTLVKGRGTQVASRLLCALVVFSSVVWSMSASPTPLAIGRPMPQSTEHHQVIRRAIALIPADASVHAQNDLFPHICHREHAYCTLSPGQIDFFRFYRYSVGQLYARGEQSVFDYVLIDDTSGQSTLKFANSASRLRLRAEYGVYAEGDGVYLFLRGYEGDAVSLAPASAHEGGE